MENNTLKAYPILSKESIEATIRDVMMKPDPNRKPFEIIFFSKAGAEKFMQDCNKALKEKLRNGL